MRSYKYSIKKNLKYRILHISPLPKLENFFKKGKI